MILVTQNVIRNDVSLMQISVIENYFYADHINNSDIIKGRNNYNAEPLG